MDERAINEFESVFESAVKPEVRIEPVTWSRILVALDGSEREASAIDAALHLAQRMKVPVYLLATRALLEGEDETQLEATLELRLKGAQDRADGFEGVEAPGRIEVGPPGETLLKELQVAPTSLIVIPTPHGGQTPDQTTLGSTVDHLLKVSDCPALLVKAPIEDPAGIFERILAYLPGGFEVGPHFSIPFDLVQPEGELGLMHVINAEEVARYAAAFGVTHDGDDGASKAQAMVRGIEEKMTGLLREAVKAVHEEPFTCKSIVEEGDPVQAVTLKLFNERVTLLVVESESRPDRPVTPEAYTLLKEITGVPILAL